jgi:hypothetical protein
LDYTILKNITLSARNLQTRPAGSNALITPDKKTARQKAEPFLIRDYPRQSAVDRRP